MGTPSDPDEPDYEDGNECAACFNVIFNGHTPKYVKAKFDGIIECPTFDPPVGLNDSFILKQRDGFACRWQLIFEPAGQWVITWRLNMGAGANNSQLDVEVEAAFVFRGRSSDTCEKTFSNNLQCGDGWTVHEGTGAITWGPNIDEAAYDAQFP